MTDQDKQPAKIVNLHSRHETGDGAREDIGELLQACRGIALKRLGGCFNVLFERADDALFDFGEKADTNAKQMRFFDDLRELRRKRGLVERLFHQGIARAFSDFTTHRQSTTGDKPIPGGNDDDELSLLDEDALEETLTFNNMVNKAENRFPQELHALNRRISVLAGGAPVETENNPVGPAQICGVFRTTTTEFKVDSQSSLILYKLFDRFVLTELGALYDELNSLLIEAGVLPQLKTPFRRATDTGAKPKGAAVPGQTSHVPEPARPAHTEDAGVVQTIRGLLASRHEGKTQTAPGRYQYHAFDEEALTGQRPGATAYYAHLDLINALAVLQGEIAKSARHIQPGAIAEIKHQLVNQVSKLTDTAKEQKMSSNDEDTIDLVGMLFEFILTDRNLPDTIQALLARLQIPYLKIALMDKRFFVQRDQPARRLLNDMARAGIGWTPDNDKDRKLLNKLRDIVDRILNEFDDDLFLFESLLADFNEFLAKQQRIADAAEKRTTEATRGRERLQEARRRSAREIVQRVEHNQLPEPIQRLLAGPWANVLVLTLLRYGEHSRQWAQALQVADDLIWCARPKPEEADRMRMIELVYPIDVAIREGLVLVALHEDEVERILAELVECFEAILTEEPIKRDAMDTQAETEQGQTPRWIFEADTDEAPTLDPAADYAEELHDIERLALGTWVEFDASGAAPQRAKLSWISPISHRYLFVNPKGVKIADKTREELARALEAGDITILDEVPIFDRAMDAIAEKLKSKEQG